MTNALSLSKRVQTLILLLPVLVSAQIPAGYYDQAADLSGAQLKAALHDIISDHIRYPYTSTTTDVWDLLKATDEDPDNPDNVILLYTGRSQAKTENSGESSSTGSNRWNREHVWSKSHGFPAEQDTAYTDIHHLRPADESVNSSRNNLDFDNGGTAHVEATACFYDEDSWEPRDAVKGDIARMMFYMAVRYDPGYHTDNSLYDLELVDETGYDIGDPPGLPRFGKLSTLIQWHLQDPVDAFEQNRNEVIYGYQGNRNPFIDHPEWVESIFSAQLSSNTRVDFSQNSLSVEEEAGVVSLTLSIINADPEVATTCLVQLSGGSGAPEDIGGFSSQTVTFPAGSSALQAVPLQIVDDEETEGSETFIFSIMDVAGGDSASAGSNDSFVLTILANDQVSAHPGLIISEVMDGNRSGGQPKFVEISNVSDAAIPIGDFQIWRGSNGGDAVQVLQVTAGTILEPQGSWVLANSAAGMAAAGYDPADQLSSDINGNGNDVYQLRTATGIYVDAFGLVGESSPWYENSVAERLPHILSGGPSYSAQEWTITTLSVDSPANGTPGTPGIHFSDPWVGVQGSEKPETHRLLSIFPNPFNASTTIRFQMLDSSQARLELFSIQGHLVATLADEPFSTGIQEVQFDGQDLPSGIYLLRLSTQERVQVQRLTLLK